MSEVNIEAESLDELQEAIFNLASRVGVAASMLPRFGAPDPDAGNGGLFYHVEADADGFHLVELERGHEKSRKTSKDPNDIVYWVFELMTFAQAMCYELEHREGDDDFRRVLFLKQEELMGQINPSWRERMKDDHQKILDNFPYDDKAVIRAGYCKELRDSGVKPEKAWELACEKFPLPEGKY